MPIPSQVSQVEVVARCSCGRVEIHARGTPITSLVCYCDDCQKGSERVESLPQAKALRDACGGTHYVLFRKDRIAWARGKDLTAPYKIRDNSPTRRNIATCCNFALMIDFENWQPWISLYGAAIMGQCPTPKMRLFTKFADSPDTLPDDMPRYSTYPLKLPVQIMLNVAAMQLGM